MENNRLAKSVIDTARIDGKAEEKLSVVKNLLTQTDLNVEKIAQVADVPISFVEKVKASL
jgi:hypothetical protein